MKMDKLRINRKSIRYAVGKPYEDTGFESVRSILSRVLQEIFDPIAYYRFMKDINR